MEAFESFVAIALEAEGYVVSEAVKFPVTFVTEKAAYEEIQTHGFEVDLVAARSDHLVLATVKSFFGSRGVVAEYVKGTSSSVRANKRYALLNDPLVRRSVIDGAAKRFGYRKAEVEVRLYAGRFAAPTKGTHEREIREWAGKQRAGGGPIKVFGVKDVVERVLEAASRKQYRDNAVLVTMKVLEAAGLLRHSLPDDIGSEE